MIQEDTSTFLTMVLRSLTDAESEAQFHARLNVLYELRPVEDCLDATESRYSLPADPALREALAEIQGRLNRLQILAADDLTEANDEAHALLLEARKVGFAPLVAEVLGRQGKLLLLSGAHERSIEALSEAIRMASQSGNAYVEAEAWTDLIGSYRAMGAHERALASVLATESAVQRSGSELLRTWMLNNIGGVHASLGDQRRATDYIQRALDAKRTLFGDDHPDVAISTANLARLLMDRASFDEAERHIRRSHEILAAALGPNHPQTRTVLMLLVRLEFRRGNFDEAAAIGRRFLAARSARLDNPTLRASVEFLVSRSLARLDHWEDARQAARRALELAERTSGERLRSDIQTWLRELEQDAR